jgi:ubiquinone/menaquinone biosynthesis C-methylase UbiE
VALLNRILRPFVAGRAAEKPWDGVFDTWIAEAETRGEDPNDAGDRQWGNPLPYLERHCFPHLSPDKVVLELGPGSGRYTRHLLSRASKLVLVDDSAKVVQWLRDYLRDKAECEIFLAEDCSLRFLKEGSVDVALAIGVFEHLSLEQFYLYLSSFFRVLRAGGVVVLNFDNFQSEQGFAWFKKWLPADGSRGIFRFYHPEMVRQMCADAGFDEIAILADDGRMAVLTCRK